MSSALVRQALAFVDPEENKHKGKTRRATKQQVIGQVSSHPYKQKNKKQKQKRVKSQEEIAEENIKKLLALSTPTADSSVADKIVERAIKGKPLSEKVETKVDEGKSILFPEESFEDFEKSLVENNAFMDVSDAVLGKLILVTTLTVYLVFVFWVNSYPFIDNDLSIYSYIPDPQWALLICAVWGLFFIGGLMSFTLFHIYPYL